MIRNKVDFGTDMAKSVDPTVHLSIRGTSAIVNKSIFFPLWLQFDFLGSKFRTSLDQQLILLTASTNCLRQP